MAHYSMLPTIKCSTCGCDVDLVNLGDHSCTEVTVQKLDSPSSDTKPLSIVSPKPSSPTSPSSSSSDTLQAPTLSPRPASRPTSPLQHEISLDNDDDDDDDDEPEEEGKDNDGDQDKPSTPRGLSSLRVEVSLKSPRPKPPPIDSSAANGLRIQHAPLTPASATMLSDSAVSDPSFLKSASSLIPPLTPHSASAIANFRPPSTDIQPGQDDVSPLSWSKPDVMSPSSSASVPISGPITPLDSTSPQIPQLGLFPPLRPQPLQRSFTTASDGFVSFEKKPEEKKLLGLFRRKSTKHISKKSISAPSLTTSTVKLDEMPSVPILPQSFSRHEDADNSRIDRDGRPLPSGPAPPRPARPRTIIIDQLQVAGVLPATRSISPDKKPLSPPPATTPRSPPTLESDAPPPLPPPPPPAPATTPSLPQIPEQESERRDAAADSTRARSRSRSGSRPPHRMPSSDQLPKLSKAASPSQDFHSAPPLQKHSPTASGSSSASHTGSRARTNSSGSTPPTSTSSSFSHWKTPEEEGQPASAPPADASHSAAALNAQGMRSANFSRPRAFTGSAAAPAGQAGQPRPAMRHAASMEFEGASRLARSSTSSSASNITSTAVTSPMEDKAAKSGSESGSVSYSKPALPPIPDEEQENRSRSGSLSRSRSLTSKGNCRGCGQAITGKSVKASDGRLSGRYHKDCFVCKTCCEPFRTADFYVIRDEPYCHTHYHVLNGSTCASCKKGIEGQFMQIFPNRKFHPICFSCHSCRKPLSRDYFEVNGNFYCEADARRIHMSSRQLGPSRMFPERRTPNLIRA